MVCLAFAAVAVYIPASSAPLSSFALAVYGYKELWSN